MKEFIESLASSSPTPGGGSVSALSVTMSYSLLEMVSNLTLKKAKKKEQVEKVDKFSKIVQELKEKRNLAFKQIEEDALSFDKVMEAFKLPKTNDDQKKIRKNAIQEAYKGAVIPPYNVAKLAVEALDYVLSLHNEVLKSAYSDVKVAFWQAYAGFFGAIYNMQINIDSIKDEDFNKKYLDEISKLTAKVQDYFKKAQEDNLI